MKFHLGSVLTFSDSLINNFKNQAFRHNLLLEYYWSPADRSDKYNCFKKVYWMST